jgi:hypothetical protein
MPHYKLYRCMVCKKYNATMLAEGGKGYLCYKCWYDLWKASHPAVEKKEIQVKTAPKADKDD